MFNDFKQFVPSEVCLKCDGCCRFKEADSRWRPYFSPSEIKIAALPSLPDKVFGKHLVGLDQRIKTTPCGQGFLCHFFNPQDNSCGIYHARPFECQLYPFILGKEDKNIILYVHLNCPFVSEHWGLGVYKEYAQYLVNFFDQSSVRTFLKENLSLIADYSAYRAEMDCVALLCLE